MNQENSLPKETCPRCDKEVELKKFSGGWAFICCAHAAFVDDDWQDQDRTWTSEDIWWSVRLDKQFVLEGAQLSVMVA